MVLKLKAKRYLFVIAVAIVFSISFIIAVSDYVLAESVPSNVSLKFSNVPCADNNQDVSAAKTINGHGLGHNTGKLKAKPSQGDLSLDTSLLLPDSYDLRNVDGNSYVTKVKNQGDYATSWAFGTIASIESNLIKTKLASSDIDLSEWHLAYFNYYQNDKLGDPLSNRYDNLRGGYYRGTYGDGNKIQDYLNDGGNELDACYTLANGKGLANEIDFSYNDVLQDPKKAIAEEHAYSSSSGYCLDDSLFVSSTDTKRIKEYLMKYGAASISLYCGDESSVQKFYNDKTAAHYCYEDIPCNHTVSLIGWDDNYSAENFVNKPSANGAWVAKNSWGDDWGQNGYFYISYEDKSFMNSGVVYFISAKKVKDGEKNYQYDGNGTDVYAQYQLSSEDGNVKNANKIYQANVFYSDSNNQKLSSISLGIYNTDVKINAWLYTDLKNKNNPTSGNKKQIIANKAISDMGYYTLELDNNSDVNIQADSWFSIVISIETTENDYVCIPISATANDTNCISCEYISKANGGEGYIANENSDGSIGDFYDINNIKKIDIEGSSSCDIKNYSLRIKAQTVPQKVTINVPAHTGGTIKLADGSVAVGGKFDVEYGQDVTLSIVPDSYSGYEINNLLVDSQALGIQNSYTLKNVTKSHTIDAIFKLKNHVVKVTADKNGMVRLNGQSVSDGSMNINVEHGSSPVLTIVPYAAFDNRKVTLDGTIDITDEIKDNDYTLTQVESAHTIEASFELKDFDTSVSDAIYSINSKTNDSFAIQANDQSIALSKSVDSLNQRFKFEKLQDGSYKIIIQSSGKVLEAISDTQISQSFWNDTDSQKWLIIKNDNHNYTFVSKLNNNCITVLNTSMEIGLAVSNGENSQLFSLQEDVEKLSINNYKYQISNKSFDNKVMSIEKSNDKIFIGTNNGRKDQIFVPNYIGCGYYKLIASSSDKVVQIEDNSNKNEADIELGNFDYSSNQLWKIKKLNNGYYNIISKSNDKCLSISKNDKSNVQIYQENQSNDQQFKLLQIYDDENTTEGTHNLYEMLLSFFQSLFKSI